MGFDCRTWWHWRSTTRRRHGNRGAGHRNWCWCFLERYLHLSPDHYIANSVQQLVVVYQPTFHAVGVEALADVEISVHAEITADVVIPTDVITSMNVQTLGATTLVADVADSTTMVQPSSASMTTVLPMIPATSPLDLSKVLPSHLQCLASASSFQGSHDLLHNSGLEHSNRI